MDYSVEDLKQFEQEIADDFNNAKIRSPVHLSGGNEKQLIRIFKKVKQNDWVFTTYRSHYHALLKGMPKEELKDWIHQNKSIHLMSKNHQIVSSAIVGGTLSQAVGCALSIKLQWADNIREIEMNTSEDGVLGTCLGKPHVWCFCGDMTASLGLFYDCFRFAEFNDLPITFIVEDNGLSTDTPTPKAWGETCVSDYHLAHLSGHKKIKKHTYKRIWPHYGTGGGFINFENKT